MLDLLVLWLSIVHTSTAACSAPTPIAIPVKNVQLDNGNTRRGISLAVGNPPQNFSFSPRIFMNNTWIYNETAPFCEFTQMTDAQCYTERGGLYDVDASRSSIEYADVYAAGGDPGDVQRTAGAHIWDNVFATDDLHVNNITLSEFPIGIPGFDFGGYVDKQAAIGLGRNSTLLNALKANGQISSRVWSFWSGQDSASPEAAIDGHLVLGGYDAAKASGDNITLKFQPWTTNCNSGMLVTIGDIMLDFPNGTTATMTDSSTFTACLQLNFPNIVSLNIDPYLYNFQNLTGTETIGIGPVNHTNVFSPQYLADNAYNGDMTIVLDDGLRITFQNDILVVPDRYVDDDGISQSNNSISDVVIAPTYGVTEDSTTVVGQQFFSAAYLMVNLDEETFTIWPVKPTTETDLVAIGGSCEDAEQSPEPNTDTPGSNSTVENGASSGDAASDATTRSSDKSMSAGAIAGAVIGAVVGAICLAAIVVLLVMRRKRRRRDFPSGYLVNDGNDVYPKGEAVSAPISELADKRVRPPELHTHERPVEMVGSEAASALHETDSTGAKSRNNAVLVEME